MARCTRLAPLLCALALAGVTAGAAHAQYFGQNKVQYRNYDWRSIESDHFEIYFYPGLDSLAIRVLDLAEKTNTMLAHRMGHSLGRRIPIILYGSHNDFAQTNVTPEMIDAGTGGFTEVLRNRVVLPFTGSYEDLRHVMVHELVHAFMFDLLYQGSAAALIARQSFFAAPLWFGEGLAEFYSLGMEPNAEMFLRDGIVEGYLPPLAYASGYIVYKQGQSAVSYLVERFGEERLRDLLRRIRQTRNFERGFQRSIGMSPSKFDEQWRAWLKRRYWPTVSQKDDPERFARRLTDHRKDPSNLNTAPSISPQGDRVAYFSDRRQYTDVYLMSAFDGKVLRRVIRGERSVQFESIPSFRSSIAWSPDGKQLALSAKSGGTDVLYIVNAGSGRIERRIELPCEALAYPAWSPKRDAIVVVGLREGRSDLWLVDPAAGTHVRLTDDTWDEKEPTWTPDGATITFASDRLAPMVLHPLRHERGYGGYGLFDLDVETRAVRKTLDTFGDDHAPAWSPDGRRLAFISDRGGTPNIYLYDRTDSTFTQLTDVMGGVQSLSWSRENDRLVFAAFTRGGFDVFAVREPLSMDAVVARLRKHAPQAVLDPVAARTDGRDSVAQAPAHAALGSGWPDTVTAGPARLTAGGLETADADTADLGEPGPAAWGTSDLRPLPRDSSRTLERTFALRDDGGPFAVPDTILAQRPSRYRARLAPDYAGGGFYAASGFGFVGSTQFVFSDFLGDHNLYVATDVFSNSLEETNALAIYNYLPRRWDVGAGLFHFKNYYSSQVTTLGEQLGNPRLFSERSFGLLLSTAYPFDRFRRVEFNFTQMFVERTFFDETETAIVESGREFRSVSSPSVSIVGDNALFGQYGPVNGQRYNLTYSPSFAWFDNGLAFQTVTFDARRYWDLTRGYTLALRTLDGYSGGRNAQTFRVGGFATLRGYPDFELEGSRLAIVNGEFRFPFIQQLGLVGPVPVGIFNLRGAVFADAGVVWNEGEKVRLTSDASGRRRLDDLRLGFGTGIRTVLFFLILKLDAAWTTDFAEVSQPRWHVSLGPEF